MLYKVFVPEIHEFIVVETTHHEPQVDSSNAMAWRYGDHVLIIGSVLQEQRFQVIKVEWSGKGVRSITKKQLAKALRKARYWSGPVANDCPDWARPHDSALDAEWKKHFIDKLESA